MQSHSSRTTVFSVIACLILAAFCLAQPERESAELVMSRCWQFPLGEDTGTRLTADDSRVFVGLAAGRVAALSMDGKKLWSAELGGEISSRILAGGGGLFLTTTAVKEDGTAAGDSVLYSLSPETGVTNWTTKLAASNVHYLAASTRGLVVVSSAGNAQLLESQKGTAIWRRELGEKVDVAPLVEANEMLVASGTSLKTISLASGDVTDTNSLSSEITAIERLSDGSLGVGDPRGVVSSLTNNGRTTKWRFRTGGALSAVLPLNGKLLAASHDNFVYLISTSSGHVKWRRRLVGRVLAVSRFAEKWAAAEGMEEHSPLVIVSLDTGKTAAQIPVSANESLVDRPFIKDGSIVLLTGQHVYAYSSGTCSAKKEGGPPITSGTAIQKKLKQPLVP